VLPLFLSRFLVLKLTGSNPETKNGVGENRIGPASEFASKEPFEFPRVPYNGLVPFLEKTRRVPTRNAAQRKGFAYAQLPTLPGRGLHPLQGIARGAIPPGAPKPSDRRRSARAVHLYETAHSGKPEKTVRFY